MSSEPLNAPPKTREQVAPALMLRHEQTREIIEALRGHSIFTIDDAGRINDWTAGAEEVFGWKADEIVGTNFEQLFTPEDRMAGAPARELHEARKKGCANDERWHVGRGGKRVFINGSTRPLHEAGGEIAGFIKVGRDETERRTGHDRLARRSEQLQALAETAVNVAHASTLEAKLEEITHSARRIIGANQGVVSLTRGHDWSQAINTVALTGKYDRWRDYAEAPDGSGIYSWLCEENRSVRMTQAELEAHPRWRGFGRHAQDHPPMRGWLAVPLVGRDGHNIGLIQLSDKEDGCDFDEADEAMLVQLAQLASTAVEQAQTEAALRISGARFRAAIDAVQGVLWTNDASGRMVGEQPAWASLTGQTPQQYQGYGWADAVHPEDRHASVESWNAAVAQRSIYVFEHRVRRRDGQWRRFSIRAIPVLGSDGEVEEWVGVHTDVTEQRAMEAALNDSEKRLIRALDAGRIGDWEMDLQSGDVRWSHNMRRITGLPEDTPATSETAFEVIHPDDRQAAQLAVTRAVDEDEPIDINFRVVGADGVTRWIASRGVVEKDDKGQPLRIVGVNFDISGIRETEEALRRESQTLEILNRTGAALAGELDLERVVQMVTDAGVDLTGANFGAYFHNIMDETGERLHLYTLSGAERKDFEKMGRPRATAIFGPTFRNECIVRSDDILADPRYGLSEPHRGMPKGHLPVRSYLAVPVVSRTGEVLGGLLFGHAEPGRFNERHERLMVGIAAQAAIAIDNAKLFNEVQQANETLESRVAERTAELNQAHEALRQLQKMEAVGQLTGGIAHDFNNLLTGVIGSLDMMQRQIGKGEIGKIERYATMAITSANRAAALTHRLLAFSRRQPLDPKPVNANRLVSGMEELLRRTIGEAVRLEIVTGGGLWQTKCDPHQLESAILNLAINARDAMPGGGTLTIETCNAHLDSAYAASQREVKPGQYVCICVTDSGSGMTADVITKAFEPFFTTKPIGQGTGLGLSMIYGFARQSEGYAKIYSELGRGTTIKLYLPRYYGDGEDAEEESTRLSEDHQAGHGEVVLVVEDETAVRDLVIDVLNELGYRALEAIDGPSGLKILQSDLRIDLLVSDVGLPGLNGRQLADHARERRPDLKVLFMTGYAENATIANGFLDPGMQMITKPFAIEALATRIRNMIETS